ncbi:MAG TPA: pyrroloquinoline quinone biosynthesis protein PqqE [Polyangia bacterium]|nr:pyrroloquinoline quinone biosynthesis protein PqqE [Polyangia bacterium]
MNTHPERSAASPREASAGGRGDPLRVPAVAVPRPYTLVAELSYRCPLSCGYCSNPLELDKHAAELDTATWTRVLGEAAALGILQVNLTGGEPLVRDDVEEIVAAARKHELYTNLITSGVPLPRARLELLRAAGLDSLQLSVQDVDAEGGKWIAGRDALEDKLAVAEHARELGLPLTLNVVLHRGNIARVPQFIALAERVGAERLELANTQYLGWALANREALMPSRAMLADARAAAEAASERLRGKTEILFVRPDYFADRPRACMDGWARRYVVVTPAGTALPCHQAASITTLSFENVEDRSLADIWNDSPAFVKFRGEAWMPEPCRSCDERARDFGGCRCQAFALTGDPAATDPACEKAPTHAIVETARLIADRPPEARAPIRLRRMRAG